MKSAREVAHLFCSEEELGDGCRDDPGLHGADCDHLTAAIEARDAEHAAEREALIKRATELGDTVTATAEANMDALAIVASAREADRAAYALDASRLREQVRVAREGLDRVARERCQLPPAGTWCTNEHAGSWCDHQEARRTLTTLDTLATSGGGG